MIFKRSFCIVGFILHN